MYISMAGPGRSIGQASDDKGKVQVNVEGAEPVMAALPYMGLSGALLAGTALLPKDQEWSKVARLILAASGTGAALAGVVVALKTKKALQPKGPISEAVPPKSEEVPKVAPGQLAQMLKLDFDPLQPKTGGTTRSLFNNQYYEATIKNDSNRSLTFYPGIAIYDGEGKLYHRTPPLQRKAVTLTPGASKPMGTPELAKDAKRPDEEPIFLVPSTVIGWGPHTYAVEVQLFRYRDDGDYFLKSETIPIKYAWIG